ncbi:MAG: hypothetical protein APF80_03825 [Alphaproteobacteria bacterium BRH_c36]|nr:MAG: hypothetical protein APF80_03825 [Alphaproteobacteria bacterium BRH_c36]
MAAVPGPLAAAGIHDLAGRWSGWGSVKLTNGATEQVKCVATYFIEKAGSTLDQNLRCASASYKIDAKANYSVTGSRVSGSWEERTHSAKGEVAGQVTDNHFKLLVKGDTFTANMTMSSSACKQSISITPQGLNVDSISIGLRKC